MPKRIKLTRLLIIAVFMMALLPSMIISILILNDHYYETKQAVILDMGTNLNSLVSEFRHKFNSDAMNINLLVAERSLSEGINDILVTEDAFIKIQHFHKLSPFQHSTYLLARNLTVVENVNGNIKQFERSDLLNQIKQEISKKPLIKGQQIIFNFQDPVLLSKLVLPDQSGFGYATIAPVFNQALLYNEDMLPTGYLISLSSYQEVIGLFNYNTTDIVGIGDTSSIFALNGSSRLPEDKNEPLYTHSKMEKTHINFNFKSDSSRNTLQLSLSSFRPSKSLTDYIIDFKDSLAIGMIFTFVFSFLVSAALVRWLNQPFIKLGDIITSFHHGHYQISKKNNLRFSELQEIVNLLKSMGAQINKQITRLQKQNIELSQLAKLKDKYLSEVQDLNLKLEQRVQQQTIKISRSLHREEQNRKLLQHIANTGVKLQNSSSIEEILNLSLTEMIKIMPDKAIVIQTNPSSEFKISIAHNLICETTKQKLSLSLWPKESMPEQLIKHKTSIFGTAFHIFYIPSSTQKNIAFFAIEDKDFGADTAEIFQLFARQIGAIIKNIQLYREVERLARIDALTNIGNRKAFNDAFLRASNHRQRYKNEDFGLFMIDINGLKPINDKYGHEQGDVLICTLSQFLVDHIRDTDQVFRLAGDEFAILVYNGNNQSCEILHKRLTQSLKNKDVILKLSEGKTLNLPLSFSCGYASTEQSDMSKLFCEADEKMYQGKKKHYEESKIHTATV